MRNVLIHQASIVNDGCIFEGSVLIEKDCIKTIYKESVPEDVIQNSSIIEAKGMFLFPGIIDVHVHFREPGLTQKGGFVSESAAAVAGGVTSYLEMPNTKPLTTTLEAWNEKKDLAAEKSLANFGFFLGATNSNLDVLLKADYSSVCGVKVFMGSSTGNMLVNELQTLEEIFKSVSGVVAVHAESEAVIQMNKARYIELYGDQLPTKFHPLIRTSQACYESSALAVEMAHKFNTRLHLAHLSTKEELTLLEDLPLNEKRITSEVCIPHLWFDDGDYERLGNYIKCNPAIKSSSDRMALQDALNTNLLDVVATDHAPHTQEDKIGNCLVAASGIPSIQFSLLAMLEFYHRKQISLETIVQKMCHAPSTVYRMEKRGYIKEGFFADLVLIHLESPWVLDKNSIFSSCAWSPFEGEQFKSKILKTFVNGSLVYDEGIILSDQKGKAIRFSN